MLQNIEKVSETSRKMTINVPAEVIQSETDSMYNEISSTASIPGFRAGKVPRSILVNKFGKRVEAQLIEKIVPRSYMEAVKEAKIEPVSYPDITDRIELKQGQPLTFTVTVEVKPELDEIHYKGIELKKKTFTVEDSEIEKAINSLRESKALYAVTDEPLNEGDMAIISSEASADATAIDELSQKDFPLVLGSEAMPEEFSSALTGKKKGETAEVTISFEEDHPNKTVAGKEVLFKITISEAKEKKLPPIDDAFAQEAECENMEALRKKIRDGLTERKESGINLDYKKELLDNIIKNNPIEAPASMVQGEIESLIDQEKERAMKQSEELRPDEDLKKEFDQKARDNVRGVILLDAIGKKENIEVSEEDTRGAISEIAARNNLKPEEVTRLYTMREGSMEALRSRLFADKVLDMVLELAVIA